MLYLKTNLPGWERALRVAMGVVIATMAYQFAVTALGSWIGIGMGIMLAVTGFVGFCPMCAMVGRRSIGIDK
jgi:hypothetical protein